MVEDSFGRLLRHAVRRRWRAVVALVVLGAVAGTLVATRSVTYSSTAAILVTPLQNNPYAADVRRDDINIETEAQLVQSESVAVLARRRLGNGPSVEQLRASVDVEVPASTEVLRVTYSAKSPDGARRGAQAFVDSYLEFRGERAKRDGVRLLHVPYRRRVR